MSHDISIAHNIKLYDINFCQTNKYMKDAQAVSLYIYWSLSYAPEDHQKGFNTSGSHYINRNVPSVFSCTMFELNYYTLKNVLRSQRLLLWLGQICPKWHRIKPRHKSEWLVTGLRAHLYVYFWTFLAQRLLFFLCHYFYLCNQWSLLFASVPWQLPRRPEEVFWQVRSAPNSFHISRGVKKDGGKRMHLSCWVTVFINYQTQQAIY